MPDVAQYVKQLIELRKKDPVKYGETMKMYQTKYPQFYTQLISAMPPEEVAGAEPKQELTVPSYNSKTKLMDFLIEYWKYLIVIAGGSVVVVILSVLLVMRLTQ